MRPIRRWKLSTGTANPSINLVVRFDATWDRFVANIWSYIWEPHNRLREREEQVYGRHV